jgi:hypothetical protein
VVVAQAAAAPMVAGTAQAVARCIDAMLDQIVTAEIARQLHEEAMRTRGMAVWIVMEDQAAYPGKLVARLASTEPTPYILLANTLAEMRAALPAGLHHSDRTPADPDGLVELWSS